MKINEAKQIIIKNKKKHFLLAGRCGYFFLGAIAGWSAAHYFVIYAGGSWPMNKLFLDVIVDLIDRLGGLSVVIGAVVAIYNIYVKRKGQVNE